MKVRTCLQDESVCVLCPSQDRPTEEQVLWLTWLHDTQRRMHLEIEEEARERLPQKHLPGDMHFDIQSTRGAPQPQDSQLLACATVHRLTA